jgi:hypothetical protein
MQSRLSRRLREGATLATCVTVGVALAVAVGSDAGVPGTAQASPRLTVADVSGPPRSAAAAEKKLDPTLLQLDRIAARHGERAARGAARSAGVPLERGYVVVEIESAADVESAVVRVGGTIERRWRNLTLAHVPAAGLRALAANPSVARVEEATPLVNAGWATSEGVGTTNAAAWHWAGITGRGVKVAVVDNFARYKSYIDDGELPKNVVTKDLCGGDFEADEHGSGVAAVIHDMAPDAQLYLVCADYLVDLGAAVDYAKSQGVDIINLSGGVYNDSSNDGTGGAGTAAAAVASAHAGGIFWVNAAGNDAETHWSGTFTDTDGNGFHEFATGVEEARVANAAEEEFCVYLSWDDWPASAQDYDLELTRDGTPVKVSNVRQDGTVEPKEGLCWNWHADGIWGLRIRRHQATTAPRMDFFVVGGALESARRVAAGSLLNPAGSPKAFAVGAICWRDASLRPYSSQGPNIRGVTKPDIAAPTNVTVLKVSPAERACGEGGFSGTSAAAPHAAGAAALVKQANPAFGPDQLKAFLEGRAVDLGSAGKDNEFGAGRLSLGAAPAPSTDAELKRGDLFVGVSIGSDSFGQSYGGKIVRVRGDSAVDFCRSPYGSEPGNRWLTPGKVILDSAGGVVFLASSPTGFGLFRCASMGSTAELLAMLGHRPGVEPGPGQADPFPADYFEAVSGLHLARVRSVVIEGTGKPKTVTEDAYAFAAAFWEPDGRGRYALKTLRFRATTRTWDLGPEPVQTFAERTYHAMPDLANWGGFTYSGLQAVLRRSKDHLRIDVGDDAHFAFGGYTEVGVGPQGGIIFDNVRNPNVPSGCGPSPHPDDVPLDMPFDGGGFRVIDLSGLVYAPGAGLVLQSTSIATGWPYVAAVSEALLDEDPSNDEGEHFHQAYAGCAHVPSLKGVDLLPFSSEEDGTPNSVWQLASGPYGLVGTQGYDQGKVVAVSPGDKVATIAEGLFWPRGIAAYPPDVPEPSGTVITVKIDSPVDVLMRDPGGRRIGVADGQAVNDFGENGYDSGPGEPRVLALKNPGAGEYSLDFVGTGSGPYTITVYSSDLTAPEGERISVTGTVAPGTTGDHDFTVRDDGAVAFINPPPQAAADTTAPALTLVVKARQKLLSALRKGLRATAGCSEACTMQAKLLIAKKLAKKLKLPTVVGKATKNLAAAGTTNLVVKFTAKARRKLAKLRSVRLTLELLAADAAGNAAKARKVVTLTR